MIAMLLMVVPLLLSCYTVSLRLQMNDSGQGVAWVYMEYKVPEGKTVDTDDLNGRLQDLGWETQAVADVGGGKQMASGFKNFTPGNLNGVIRSIPGFDESGSTMSLNVEEDPTLGIKKYTFQSHLLMTQHVSAWSAMQEATRKGISENCDNTPLAKPGEECLFEWTPQEMQQIVDEAGPPQFQLTVAMPGKLESEPAGLWIDGDQLKADWRADTGAGTLNLRAVTIQHPETEAPLPDTLAANEDKLLDRFTTELGVGQIVSDPSAIQNYLTGVLDPGKANNLTNGQSNACGWWQGKVLDWLDSIRLNPEEEQRALLNGLDYGPIQAYYGGHQAVVLFPKGTDWNQTGIVLDPWPNQIPESSSIADWKGAWGIGSTFGAALGIGPGQRAEDYPQLNGGASSYPDTSTQAKRVHFRRLTVNSPVNVLITDTGGHRIGALPDGTIVNEIPGADFYPPPEAEPEGAWYFGLPDAQYTMQTMATGPGDMHILVAGEGDQLITYGAQPVSDGRWATIPLSPDQGLDTPMTLDDGATITPRAATLEALQETFAQTRTERNPTSPADLPPDSIYLPWQALVAFFGGAGVLAVCCAIPVVGIAALLLVRARRSRQPQH